MLDASYYRLKCLGNKSIFNYPKHPT